MNPQQRSQVWDYYGQAGGGDLPNDYWEHWFSVGIPTDPVSFPAMGTSTYTGRASGRHVAADGDPADLNAAMQFVVNFATRQVVVSTSASTLLSANSVPGALPSPSIVSNFQGTISYAAGSNSFSGVVADGTGGTGNVTCRFYGPGLAAATASKVISSPTEVGCTFALLNAAVAGKYGAMGAN